MRFVSACFLSLSLLCGLPSCGGAETSSSAGGSTSTSTASGGGGAGGSSGSGGSTAGSGGATTTTTPIDKAAACTDTFGDALTNAFGRIDGTVLAVLKPTDQQCPLPNSDHVIIEVTMNGAVYRMVVNVRSDFGPPDVDYLAIDHALPEPAWSEGWHPGLTLDYATVFGVKADEFKPYPMAELSDMVVDEIPLDAKISVYASSSGGASAHKVHRNNGVVDGAIVLDPTGPLPRVLLFHFSDQMF